MESQVCKRIKDAESESVVHIPQEITENILTRLPRKSLVRFKSVCKSWRSWLTNPDFRRRDSQLVLYISASSKGGFFQTTTEQGTPTEKFPLPWGDSKSNVYVSNSCNGMVLICVGNCFYLFNPSTHYFAKVLKLDYMSDRFHEKRHYDMLIGLYYDEAISDYKAVVLVQYRLYKFIASILVEASLKGKQWNHIDHNPIKSGLKFRVGPVVNGRLHWLNDDGLIIRFNPVLKVFENLPYFQPPLNYKKGHRIVGIGFLEGCLCVSRTVNWIDVEILAMKEYGVSEFWTPIFSFSDKEFYHDTCICDCSPLLLTRAGEIVVSIKSGYYYSSLIQRIWLYNLRRKSSETYLKPDKYKSTICAASFVQNMDTPSGYYWNQAEHENFGKTENVERMEEYWKRID